MTVVREDSFIERTADGVQTDYTFDFPFIEDDDIKVYINGTGIASTEYTLTADPLTGGTIAFNVAPIGGSSVLIRRDTPATQETDYPPYGPFPAESHERALDKLTMLVQEALASSDIIVTTQLKYAGNWSPLTFYDIMNIVWYDNGNGGDYYVCNSSHTSGSTFESQYWNVFIDLDNFWTAHDDALQAAVDAAASAVAADVAATSAGDSAAAAANSQVAAKLSEDNSKQSELNAEESSQRSSDCAAFAFEQAASVNLPLPSTGDADDVIAVNQTQDGWALAKAVMKDSDVGAGNLPVGTEAERPAAPTPGMIRFNSDEGSFEGYNGVEWGKIGGGGLRWVMVTAADSPITAEDGVGYICDTNAGPIAIELPPITEEGLTTGAMDKNGNFVSNGVLFLPNGADTIMGVANLELDEQYQAMTLVSSDSPDGWRIYTITPNSDDDTLQNQIDTLALRPRKNLIINGDFQIWQRATDATSGGGGYYAADRWRYLSSLRMVKEEILSAERQYAASLYRSTTGTLENGTMQGVELYGSQIEVGKTYTFSAEVLTDQLCDVKLRVRFRDSVGSTTNQVDVVPDTIIKTALQPGVRERVEYTFTIPQAPNPTNQSMEVYIAGVVATSWTPNTSKFQITNVQLEEGDKATDFERRPAAEEYVLCQRYFQRVVVPTYIPFTVRCGSGGTLFSSNLLRFPVELRTQPTTTNKNTSVMYVRDTANDAGQLVLDEINVASPSRTYTYFTATGVGTNQHAYLGWVQVTLNAWLDAEL